MVTAIKTGEHGAGAVREGRALLPGEKKGILGSPHPKCSKDGNYYCDHVLILVQLMLGEWLTGGLDRGLSLYSRHHAL